MALKGKAKTDYQRDYMRQRRKGLTKPDIRGNRPPTLICLADVRPTNVVATPKYVRPIPSPLPNCPDGRYRPTDADGNPIYEYWLSEGKE